MTNSSDDATDPDAGEVIARARERIDALADEGPFVVACKDTGTRPAPVADATFPSYEVAERARTAAAEYRAALGRLDPELPSHDLVVCDTGQTDLQLASVRRSTDERRENGLPSASRTVTVAGGGTDEWLRVDDGPVVHLAGPDSLLDDEVVARQLRTKL